MHYNSKPYTMRISLLFALFILGTRCAESQNTATYSINYTYINETLRVPIDQPFTMPYYMIANADSSKLYFRRAKQPNTDILVDSSKRIFAKHSIITSDTQFYKNEVWIDLDNDIRKPIKTFSIKFTETGKRRKIFGYPCTEFVATDSVGNQQVVMWASKELPSTINPFVGLISFPYGILEVRHLIGGWKLIPRRVKKMK